MRDFPKYLNSKQDYINLFLQRPDRDQVKKALQHLLSSRLGQKPLWPEGYDPETADPNEPVSPVGFEEVEDPHGLIFRLSISPDAVTAALHHLEIEPIGQALDRAEKQFEAGNYDQARSELETIAPDDPWVVENLMPHIQTALSAISGSASGGEAEPTDMSILDDIRAARTEIVTARDEIVERLHE